jgi:hypothetical protein
MKKLNLLPRRLVEDHQLHLLEEEMHPDLQLQEVLLDVDLLLYLELLYQRVK